MKILYLLSLGPVVCSGPSQKIPTHELFWILSFLWPSGKIHSRRMCLQKITISFLCVGLFDISVSFSTTQLDYRLSIPNPKCGVFQHQEPFEHQHAMKAHAQYYSNILY